MNRRIFALLVRHITGSSRWALALLAAHGVAVTAHAAMPYKFSSALTTTGTISIPGTTKVVPRLLPTSKFMFNSNGVLTVSLQGVRDAAGKLVTTTKDPADPFAVSGDEYIVTVHAAPLNTPGLEFELAIPVELKAGAGKTVMDLQYLVDQGLNYLNFKYGTGGPLQVAAQSVLVWAPNKSAILSPECTSGALTRPNTAASWVGGFTANYWLPPTTGGPAVNPCTSGAPVDIVGVSGITVNPGGGSHGGGCQIGLPASGTAAWLLLMPAAGLLMRRRRAR